MISGTLSILIRAYPEEQKGLAIGLNGGILVHGDNWRWIFFINAPLGILTIVLSLLFINKKQDNKIYKKINWNGLIVLSTSLLAILL